MFMREFLIVTTGAAFMLFVVAAVVLSISVKHSPAN
jgi:hypothetical protein